MRHIRSQKATRYKKIHTWCKHESRHRNTQIVIWNFEYLDFKRALRAPFASFEWVSVTHFLLNNDAKSGGRWLYHNPSSDVEFNLQHTIAFSSHAHVNTFFDPQASHLTNIHSVSRKALEEATRHGYDSIQIYEHDKDPDGITKFEIIDLQPAISYKQAINYRSKRTLQWKPFAKFVVSNAFGPNIRMAS